MSTNSERASEGFSSGVRVYTVGEVAETMRVSRMSVYRLIHTGSLQSLKVGSSYRVTQTALDLFLTRADYIPSDGTVEAR